METEKGKKGFWLKRQCENVSAASTVALFCVFNSTDVTDFVRMRTTDF